MPTKTASPRSDFQSPLPTALKGIDGDAQSIELSHSIECNDSVSHINDSFDDAMTVHALSDEDVEPPLIGENFFTTTTTSTNRLFHL